VPRQRISAYALVLRDGPAEQEVLLTQLSDSTTRPGAWTLPGGGVDHGEDPGHAVLREVHEETGLEVTVGRVLDVHSLHHEGVAPDGVLEDYHALRLVFEGTVPVDAPDPRVLERDGTTADARWFPLREVQGDSDTMVGLVTWALAASRRASRAARAVRDLHDALGIETPTAPVSSPAWRQRAEMIREELQEYEEAAEAADVDGVADALADLLYVVYGTALVHGIPLDEVFAEVHRANLTKIVPGEPLEAGTKAPKPDGYRRPDVAAVLDRYRDGDRAG